MTTHRTPSHVVRTFLLVLLTLLSAAVSQAGASGPAGNAAYTGGSDAGRNEHPYVAGLRKSGHSRFFCTGTLVAKRWVLTAAHCVDGGLRSTDFHVVVGDTSLSDNLDAAELHAVDRVVVHRRWGGDAGDTHDVALLRLTVDSKIAPVKLGYPSALAAGVTRCVNEAKRALSTGRTWTPYRCEAARGTGLGWGRTPASGDSSSLTLRQAPARILDWPRRTFWIAKSGACPGDSGGPLLVPGDDGAPRQIGIASYAQHGGGVFDFLVGGRCSSKGRDYYSDVSGGSELNRWVATTLSPRPGGTTPTCPPYKPCANPRPRPQEPRVATR